VTRIARAGQTAPQREHGPRLMLLQ
jgi:hypothetical protein